MKLISEPIYKLDSNGKVRTWQYEVVHTGYRAITGLKGGKLVYAGFTICEPKNVGKINATTATEQALLEGAAEEKKKLNREYRRTEAELLFVPPGPMLANDYKKLKKPLTFPVFSQPKLDGIRALISRHGAFSREFQPHYNCDHILEALAPIFETHPDLVLDGEFYNHDLKDDFNKIASVVRKQKPTEAQKIEAKRLLQYHVYDLPSHEDFGRRLLNLLWIGNDYLKDNEFVKVVDTYEAHNQQDLDVHYGQYLEDGYEGQMVRLDTPYDFDTRSKSLLKRKEFITEEFEVSKVIEGIGNWAGYAKAIEFILPGDKRLENGERPRAGMRGSQDFNRELLKKSRAGDVPKYVTIRYFNLTPYGIPRFPVAIDFHFGERKD